MQLKNLDVNHQGKDEKTALMVVGRLGCTDKECSETYDVLLNQKDTLIGEDMQGKSAL